MSPEGAPRPDEFDLEAAPQRRVGWWDRLRQRFARPQPAERPAVDRDELEEMRHQRVQEREQEDELHQMDRLADLEHLELPTNPEEMVDLLANMTSEQYRQRQLEARYGGGRWGRFKAFLAGEHDFSLTEDGEIRRTGWNQLAEAGRKVLTVLGNKKVVISGSITLIVGAVTGGVGVPAAMALTGMVAGGLAAETAETLKGNARRLRGEIAQAEYRRFQDLQRVARSCYEEGISEEERANRLTELNALYHSVNQEVRARQQELTVDQTIWDKRRATAMAIGGAAGLAAGFAHIGPQLMHMDLNGDGIAHTVSQQNGEWFFSYNTAAGADAAGAAGADVIKGIGEHGGHVLGKGTAEVMIGLGKNLLPHVYQGLAAFGAFFGSASYEKRRNAGAEAALAQQFATQDRNSAEEQSAWTRGMAEVEPEPEMTEEEAHWREVFGEGRLPEPGQRWVVHQPGLQPFMVIVDNIDFEAGTITLTQADTRFVPILENDQPSNIELPLDLFARDGRKESESTETWFGQFGRNDTINLENLPAGAQIVDNNGRPIEPGQYQVIRREDRPGLAILRRAGQEDREAPVPQFLFFGINRVQPEPAAPQAERRVERPRVGHVWRVANRDALPDNLQASLPNDFAIISLNDDEMQVRDYDTATGQLRATVNTIIRISLRQWDQIQANLQPTAFAIQVRPENPGGNQGRGGNNRGRNP